MTAAANHPLVQGRCPACRGASLFLGSGGYVTCARLDCPDPCAADKLLHGEQAAIARVRRLIEQHSVAVGTHLLEEALDGTPAHNAGPSVREAAANDRAHWDTKYAGEGQ